MNLCIIGPVICASAGHQSVPDLHPYDTRDDQDILMKQAHHARDETQVGRPLLMSALLKQLLKRNPRVSKCFKARGIACLSFSRDRIKKRSPFVFQPGLSDRTSRRKSSSILNPLFNWLRPKPKHVAPAAEIVSWAEFYDALTRSRHGDVKSMLP